MYQENWIWAMDRNKSSSIKKFALMPAVEVYFEASNRFISAEMLSADISHISSESMLLNLQFDDPNRIQDEDKVIVKFWRNDLFINDENGA